MKKLLHIFSLKSSAGQSYPLAGALLFLFLCTFLPAAGQNPSIESFNPRKTFYGDIITISGSGFAATADLAVRFGAAHGLIVESNSTTIKVKVPAGATYGPLSVTNVTAGLTAYSSQPFLLSFGGQRNGTAPFAPPVSYPAAGTYNVCACDLDGDGRNDLTGSNQNSTSVKSYLNESTIGSISFPVGVDIFVGQRTLNANCGDLDGDGKADLVFTGYETGQEKIIYLRNTSTPGSIRFAAPQELGVTGKIWAKAAIHDMDMDGKPEIVLTNKADNQVVVFSNTSTIGTISFSPEHLSLSTPGSSNEGLRIKDVNNDGLPDITTSNLYGNRISFLLNTSSEGNLRFDSPLEFRGSNLANHELEDLDGDGKPDLISLDYINGLAKIQLNTSSDDSLSFAAAESFSTGPYPTGIELGDFNGDKKVDLLIGKNLEAKAYLLLNTSTIGALSFQTLVLSGTGKFTNVQASDLDGDAIPDVAIADKDGGRFVLFRNQSCIYPATNPSGTVTLCEDSSLTLNTIQNPAAETDPPLMTYQWLKDGAVVGTGYSLTVSSPGNYSVEMTSTVGCSATSSDVIVTTFSESIGNPAIDALAGVCESQPLTLSVSPATEGATYTWSNNLSGFQETTDSNSLTIAEADPSLHAGTYTVTIAKGSCELALQSPEASIYPLPAVAVTTDGPLSFCSGESRSLSVEEGYTAYQWKKDGVSISGANAARFTTAESGSYTVVIKNVHNCEKESASIQLENKGELIASFEAPAVACLNQPVQFTDKSNPADGETAVYLWDFGDGSQSSDPSPSHTYTQTGSSPYEVSLTVQYENSSCSSTYSKLITVKSSSNISLEVPGSVEFCAGDSVKVQVKGEAAAVKWSNGSSGPFTFAKEGGLLQAEVLTTAGCTVTQEIELRKLPAPELELSAESLTIERGETVQLRAKGGISYLWEPAGSLDNPTIAQPLASPTQTTTYTVVATSANGCTAKAEITIEVEFNFKVHTPKLFIPATDQWWRVSNIENYPDVSLLIMNQFGKIVYRASPYQNNWDGTGNGSQLKEGVFFYVFQDTSGQTIKSGSITLIR